MLVFAIVVSWAVPPYFPRGVLDAVAAVFALFGAAVVFRAARAMGKSWTMFPCPAPQGRLVVDGPFAFVRHPIYAGGLAFFIGCSLAFSVLGLVLTGVLGVLWAAKATIEERHLEQRFPEYREYRARVRFRFVPFIF